ncbi:DUF1311 domain-containing protein [soil metagenome]
MKPRLNFVLTALACSNFVQASFTQTVFAADARETVPEACKPVKKLAVPEDQMPSMKDRDNLEKCSSEKLYYGIGQPADPLMARHCAVLEDEMRDQHVYGGSSILMMVYANGLGAKQNYDLALHFACDIQGAPAEVSGRVAHLVKLKKENIASPKFDLCDDITSGFMMGQCAAHGERIAKVQIAKEVEAAREKMSPAELKSYDLLRKAADAYAFTHSQEEVDLSGTARSMFITEAEGEQTSKFMLDVKKMGAGEVPEVDAKFAAEIDNKLNVEYAKLKKMKVVKDTTITFQGIQTTQKVWLKYRDAWVAYAHLKAPNLSANAVTTWQTAERLNTLQSFLQP